MLKKIDKLVANSFWGPYILSFFVAEFVLLMQLLWKFIDDILGKGIGFFEIMRLLGFFAVTMIPMAIPLTILISSVMVFGNLSEKYELSSMKSAGVSLIRIMRSGILIAIATFLLSLLASNYLAPKANFEFMSRMTAIRKQKPALSIEQGIFNKDFKGYVIRVEEKSEDGVGIEKVQLWDHTDSDKSLVNMTHAESGEMYVTNTGDFFTMKLKDGIQYKEDRPTLNEDRVSRKYPFVRTSFTEWTKVFDMSEFGFDIDEKGGRRKKEDLLNTFQLVEGIDSIQGLMDLEGTSNVEQYVKLYNGALSTSGMTKNRTTTKKVNAKQNIPKSIKDTIPKKDLEKDLEESISAAVSKINKRKTTSTDEKVNTLKSKIKNSRRLSRKNIDDLSIYSSFYETVDSVDQSKLVKRAFATSRGISEKLRSSLVIKGRLNGERENFIFKFHQQYSIAFVCILFLFIGAPLGSIIRKGGYGIPLLAAILFYMIFMISAITAAKLLRAHTMSPIFLAWLPCIILAPMSLLLTWLALQDRKMSLPSFNFFKKDKDS